MQRTHWLFPIVVPFPNALVTTLRCHGVDASHATSSIAVVEAPAGRAAPSQAARMMSGIVFLPVYPELPFRVLERVIGIVNGSGGTQDVEELVRA